LRETVELQPALLENVRTTSQKLLSDHDTLTKRLKADLAHWKASAEQSKDELTAAKEALAMYRDLTNVSLAEVCWCGCVWIDRGV
jgi:hypothetical protein